MRQQTKSEPDLYTLLVPVNTTLFLSKSCDNMADSVALDLNMNQEYSVVQWFVHDSIYSQKHWKLTFRGSVMSCDQ